MRKDVIRLGRRRRPRVHIIKQDMTRRAVRDASCAAGRENSLAPMLVLTCTRAGGHQCSSPPRRKIEWPPTYAEGHTRNIHRCTLFARPAPWVFHNTPRGWFQTSPGYRTPPGVFASTPGGGFGRPSGYEPPPGAREVLPGGWIAVRMRGPRCPRPCRCGARPPERPAAASAADTTTARSRP